MAVGASGAKTSTLCTRVCLLIKFLRQVQTEARDRAPIYLSKWMEDDAERKLSIDGDGKSSERLRVLVILRL